MPHDKRQSIYDQVTAKVIADLEQGRVPWVQPWGTSEVKAPLCLPRNALTGRSYSGINILILWHAVVRGGYGAQSWLTFRQAQQLGGTVRKGERGVTACHADSYVPKSEAERADLEGVEPEKVAFLKRFTLFNIEQCDGLPAELFASGEPASETMINGRAEALIEATGADFRVGGYRAYYVPSGDFIQVPPRPAFFEPINYYRTCFHELGHWTGHESRLARTFNGRFGSRAYAREELVAEMASAFLCASLGIAPTVRHADYIATWREVLKEDQRAIFNAASHASKAADFILAFQSTNDALEALS